MPDAIFDDARLVAVYDAIEGSRDDLGHYLAIAGEFGAHHVVDVGCGTGSLAVLLAASGRHVTGVDPAAASLAVARTKPHADEVDWILGDATSLPALDADLVTMTGNVAQVFLTDDDWHATLDAIARALRVDGRLVFETRQPSRQAWLGWAADLSPHEHDVDGVGHVVKQTLGVDAALPYVSFRERFVFGLDGAVVDSSSTLRFRERDEIESSLTAAGFAVRDVRDAPDRPGLEWVFVAQRAR